MSRPDPKEFGKQISRLRKARGLSQVDLAKVSGVPVTAIRRCEQLGQIPLDRYLVLASVLDASLNIHSAAAAAATYPKGNAIHSTRPNLLPFKTIGEVISANLQAVGTIESTPTVRKPQLGGMFARQSSHKTA